MDQHTAAVRVQTAHAADFSAAEPLLGAMEAELPKGDEMLDPQRMGRESGVPLAHGMVLALTPFRIVIYKTGWRGKVGARLGELPLSRVAGVEITWNRKYAIVAVSLHDAPLVVMRATVPEEAEHLRNQFLRLRGRI